MTNVVVFTGPTLAHAEAQTELDAVYKPPVSQGDLYRVSRLCPTAIGIIDGYFERVPAVWHKEILWAMSQGIHVFGSASMGALRAAELESFGMEGIGVVFTWYRHGTITDDDEVAIVHGTEDTGFLPLSEPMVNIRATLGVAERAGVVGPDSRRTLERVAKELFYPLRSYQLLLETAASEGVP